MYGGYDDETRTHKYLALFRILLPIFNDESNLRHFYLLLIGILQPSEVSVLDSKAVAKSDRANVEG